MEILKKWEIFKTTICVSNEELNDGIEINNTNYFFPEQLYYILKESNGQKKNTLPIFGEFRNTSSGIEIIYYNFLSLQEILETFDNMKNFNYEKSISLIPFAKKITIANENSINYVLCVNKDNSQIYRVCFFHWERFVNHKEFQSEKIAKNLDEFLDNQILWYKENLLQR